MHWALLLSLTGIGAAQIALARLKIKKGQRAAAVCSMALSVAAVLFLALTREAYAIVVAFLLLVVKAMLLWMSRA